MNQTAKKTALICGVSGQDGGYLAQLLLEKNYRVVGTSRDAQTTDFRNLRSLGIFDQVEKASMALTDFRSVLNTIRHAKPDEIYHLAGQSSVGLSFEQPVETLESVALGTLNLLEAARFLGSPARIYHASSSECFGETGDKPVNEETAFQPKSPYATAKAAAHWMISNYREAYGMFACNGILFNHESPLRPKRFVTGKIISTACQISAGANARLKLGDIDIRRDWGWAPEYVEAMWLMLQQETPQDFVIATGKSHSLREFCEFAFATLGLELPDYLDSDPSFKRPTEIRANCGDASKAERLLGWRAKSTMRDVISMMIKHELPAYSDIGS